mgnify:CR=1 FL=1
MCGLAFLYDQTITEALSSERMAAALLRMHHRGPDAQELLQKNNATFGHVRLSIVDVSGSPQPMNSADGRYTVVFNGEIYNYKELKEGLVDRWTFKTNGDTEVLLAGLVLSLVLVIYLTKKALKRNMVSF